MSSTSKSPPAVAPVDEVTGASSADPETASPTQPVSTADGTGRDDGVVLGMTSGDRRVLTVLVGLAVVLMIGHWYRLTQSRPQPMEVLHPRGYRFQLDVNRASWVEWMQLDRIGETLARRIVAVREQHGPFQSVEDVQRVPGIGPKTIGALRKHLTCRSVASGGRESPAGDAQK